MPSPSRRSTCASSPLRTRRADFPHRAPQDLAQPARPSALTFCAIPLSSVDIRSLPLSAEDVPLRKMILPRRFPMWLAFPTSEYYQRVRLPPRHPPSCGRSFQSAYSALAKTVAGLPGSSTLPFPTMPCSPTPPGSPTTLPYRLPTVAFQAYDPVGPRFRNSRGSIASLTLQPGRRSAYA